MNPPARTRPVVLFAVMTLNFSGFAVAMLLLPRLTRELGGSGLDLGLAFGLYSLLQLVCVPLWGALADRFGRRPVLLLAVAGSALSYVMLAHAHSIEAVWLSRIVAGALGADLALFKTVAADLSAPAHRVRAMGRVGAAFGLAFILGSGVAAGMGHLAAGVIAGIAAGCSLAALILALGSIGETRPAPAEAVRPRRAIGPELAATLGATRAVLRVASLPTLLGLLLVSGIAASLWESTFNLFVQQKPAFGYTMREYGRLAGLIGIMLVITQGGIAGWLEQRWRDRTLMRVGLLASAVGFLGMALADTHLMLAIAALTYAFGQGLFIPAIYARASLRCPPDQVATAQGLFMAGGTLARTLTPPFAGWLLDQRLELPLLAAALICAACALAVQRLIGPPRPAPAMPASPQ